jgi:4-amino-4-deoxy-L-arabinose transferase-like glycosyltransferase
MAQAISRCRCVARSRSAAEAKCNPGLHRGSSARVTVALAVAAVVIGSWRLGLNGLGNSYYTAADLTGAHSLHRLFFAAFDGRGVMAIDKPPLGLVGPAFAVRAFGLSSWTILGPQVLYFAATIAVLHRAVLRWFGPRAATIGAVSFLLTPINVAVARSNNPDALLVLLTAAALVMTVDAVRNRRFGIVVLAGFAIGLAFTTKQLQAFVPVPALVVGIAVLSAGRWTQRVLRALLFTAVVAASSFAWIAVVDHVPASDRPYIANSSNNTEQRLALGFNGTNRVERPLKPPSWVPKGDAWTSAVVRSVGRLIPQRSLLGNHYAAQTSWLLVPAVIGAALLVAAKRRSHQPRDRQLRLLFGWTVFHVAVLMYVRGKFSPYYVAPLTIGISALFGVVADTALEQVQVERVRPSRAVSVRPQLTIAVLVSLAVTSLLEYRAIGAPASATATFSAVLACWVVASSPNAIAAGVEQGQRPRPWLHWFAAASAIVAFTAVPMVYVVGAVSKRSNPASPNAELTDYAPSDAANVLASRSDLALVAFVHANGLPIATSRISVASALLLQGDTVVPLGGFFGTDKLPSLGSVEIMIRSSLVRWVAVPDLSSSTPTTGAITIARPWGPWARSHCREIPARRFGGLDTTTIALRTHTPKPSTHPLALFDCALAARRFRVA